MSDDLPGMKFSGETMAHYFTRQLLLIESLNQPDEAFGAMVRRILQRARPRLERELDALEAVASSGPVPELAALKKGPTP